MDLLLLLNYFYHVPESQRDSLRLQEMCSHRQKRKKIYLKSKEINWLIGKKSHLSIQNKLLIYKAVIKPTWSYGIELWGYASKSNTVIMQRSQSIILRAIANAPWYVKNHTLRTDFNIPYVIDVIHGRINKHRNKLGAHPNPLLEPLLQPINTRRLKRCWPLDLQSTWGDIAGWIPYHIIVKHGIVAYLYNHHISS
jgi:hypothetical protein